MQRIAESLQTEKQRVIIVSPATCLFPRKSDRLMHKVSVGRTRYNPVLFCPALATPILSAIFAYFSVPFLIKEILRKRRVSAIIIYNFSPLLVIIAYWLKYFKRLPLFHNVEDVSVPRLQDWLPGTEARPMQQLIFSVSMKLIAGISDGLIVPSKKFLNYLPSKTSLTITGCIDTLDTINITPQQNEKVIVLFAGKISREHGIAVFVDALKIIAQNHEDCGKLQVWICGTGPEAEWLRKQLPLLTPLSIKYLGFVSDLDYQTSLKNSDICIALQSPTGRYAMLKTPSKVYEYLGNAKAVIATKVGDLSDIPDDVLSICHPYTGEKLAKQIRHFLDDPTLLISRKSEAGLFALNMFSYKTVGKRLLLFLNSKGQNS